MFRDLGHNVNVLGVSEGEVKIGTPWIWDTGFHVAERYRAKAPKPPRGMSVNRGRREEQFDD